MTDSEPSQSPTACFSCHAIGIVSSSALGAYMLYQAKNAKTAPHRFACTILGLIGFIVASHRVSPLIKDLSQHNIAKTARLERKFEDRR